MNLSEVIVHQLRLNCLNPSFWKTLFIILPPSVFPSGLLHFWYRNTVGYTYMHAYIHTWIYALFPPCFFLLFCRICYRTHWWMCPPGTDDPITTSWIHTAAHTFIATPCSKKALWNTYWQKGTGGWYVSDGQNVHKKRCRYWFSFWRRDLIALPFAPPDLSLLLSTTTWCPHQKPAIWMEPHFKWSTNTSFGTSTSSQWFHYPSSSWSWHSIPYN